LGISPASICNLPTFWNHVAVPSSKAGSSLCGVRARQFIPWLGMELIHASETSANYILTPGKYPKNIYNIQIYGESLKSTNYNSFFALLGMKLRDKML